MDGLNDESKAMSPEVREGLASKCELCGQYSNKIIQSFTLTHPYKAKVISFKCENFKCEGRTRRARNESKMARTWDVEKRLD